VNILQLFKDERELISKSISPQLKEKNYNVRLGVRLRSKHQKLRSEDALTNEELNVAHPLSPDIDLLYWNRDYTGEPILHAVEVKYFRLDKKGMVRPPLYDGIGEALLLCTYGVDYVHLWHFFDPEVSTDIYQKTKNAVELIVDKIYTINYNCKMLYIQNDETVDDTSTRYFIKSLLEVLLDELKKSRLIANKFRYDEDAEVIRKLIKRSYRLV